MSTANQAKTPHHTALALLARREHSRLELSRKLTQRGFDDAAIATLLDELDNQGLQSDRRFAEAYLRVRTEKGFGPVRISVELEQRGIHDPALLALVKPTACHWGERVARVRAKRFGDPLPHDAAQRARQSRFLSYRGFTHDQIQNVFSSSGLSSDEL